MSFKESIREMDHEVFKGDSFLSKKSPFEKPHGVQESKSIDSLQKICKNFCRQMNVAYALFRKYKTRLILFQ